MTGRPENEFEDELLGLLGDDFEFARRLRAVRDCQEWLEDEESSDVDGGPPVRDAGPDGEPQGLSSRTGTVEGENQLGDYTLLCIIGQGGMGVVYEAWDTAMNRRVALKLLRSGATLTDANALARFRREARLPSSLNHPGICTVYDAGVIEGTSYIAMAYLEGETLAARIARRKEEHERRVETPSSQRVIEEIMEPVGLIERVARSLHFFHEAGLVHRDIKPSNIMIAKEGGDPVILDFGLARGADADGTVTHTGEIVGTPVYLAPEQITAKHMHVDRRCDVYSLGVTLYESLTGRLPFEAPTRDRLFQKILTTPPPSPAQLNARIPTELRLILETALEKDPVLRYQTALDFAEDLRRVRCHEPIRARPTGVALRLGRWVQRNRMLATYLASVSVLFVVALILLWVVFGQSATRRQIIDSVRQSVEQELNQLDADELVQVVRVSAENRAIILEGRSAPPATAERLNFGVYRYKHPIEMLRNWGPLLEALEGALSKELSRRVVIDLVVFKSYDVGNHELINGEQVDFMRVGPFSFVQIAELDPGVQLLAKFRHDGPFEGCIFTYAGSGIDRLTAEQVKGECFAFGDVSSTFGSLYPKQLLLEKLDLRRSDLAPASTELGSHDAAIQAVAAQKEFALGAAKLFWVEKARREGKPLVILETFETTPIPFVARPGLDPAVVAALREVLVGLGDPDALASLRKYTDETIIGFQAAKNEDYEPVRRAMQAAERFESGE